jgi:hypothetical protein
LLLPPMEWPPALLIDNDESFTYTPVGRLDPGSDAR